MQYISPQTECSIGVLAYHQGYTFVHNEEIGHQTVSVKGTVSYHHYHTGMFASCLQKKIQWKTF